MRYLILASMLAGTTAWSSTTRDLQLSNQPIRIEQLGEICSNAAQAIGRMARPEARSEQERQAMAEAMTQGAQNCVVNVMSNYRALCESNAAQQVGAVRHNICDGNLGTSFVIWLGGGEVALPELLRMQVDAGVRIGISVASVVSSQQSGQSSARVSLVGWANNSLQFSFRRRQANTTAQTSTNDMRRSLLQLGRGGFSVIVPFDSTRPVQYDHVFSPEFVDRSIEAQFRGAQPTGATAQRTVWERVKSAGNGVVEFFTARRQYGVQFETNSPGTTALSLQGVIQVTGTLGGSQYRPTYGVVTISRLEGAVEQVNGGLIAQKFYELMPIIF